MSSFSEAPLDRLWKSYGDVFASFDDLTLARWMVQTLGQVEGRAWRLSHPLLGAYRLAAQAAQDRQVWHKRLVTVPHAYVEAECCRAPLLPLLTRDVVDTGLLCQHCGETVVPFETLPASMAPEIREWAEAYAPIHRVAHWTEAEQSMRGNYDGQWEQAAKEGERLLALAGRDLAPRLLDLYPAVVWEDQDECLEIRPEDIEV